MVEQEANERLVGEEIIPADQEFETGVILADFGDETLGGVDFTILFHRAIGVLNFFRHQGDDLPAVRMHDRGLHHLVGIRGRPGLMVRDQAMGTRYGLRMEVLRAVKRAIIKAVHDLVRREIFPPLHTGEIILENGAELLTVNRIDKIPQLRGFRRFLDVKEGQEIVPLMLLAQALLELEQGGVLKIHAGEATHQGIVEGIIDLSLLPGIGNTVKARRKRLSQGSEGKMFFGRQEIIAFNNLYT